MPTHTIIVDQDSLEYTPRDGLKTREPIPLTVGAHNRIVIRRPPRKQSASAYAAFRHDSAFPHGSALAVLLGLSFGAFFAGRREGSSERRAQIYGHAEPSGDEDHNKALSERRAKAFAALLTCSPAC